MASPPEREPKRRNSPSDSDSVTASAASSTSGDASDSVSPEEQPSAPAASPTSVSQEPSDDDDASISDCGDSSLSSLGNGEYAESDDDSGYLGDKVSKLPDSFGYSLAFSVFRQLLQDKYSRFRRAKGDDNCFFRAFMFAYLEHLLETQDKAQFDSAIEKVEQCRKTLKFGDPDYIAEDYFSVSRVTPDLLVLHEELLWKSNYRYVSNYLVFFLKIVVSVELFSKAEFYKPFIAGFENLKLEKVFCKSSVELMGECDQVRVKALTDALGVQLRIEHVVQSSNHSIIPQLQHHDYQPSASCGTAAADRPPAITLLHRCGRYYILYL
ncbi:hypothetical protein ZIOFF_033972 [Zingiber officinale]|uniref:ubiquitinyl hydrolase 1 n=1 Tax=Zingiber officinale TaxID=94328 RepID=A0A8J5L790_ZINOF|nr:hypothetical protein ZIOFF_033972 [Zingiber officinale]